MGGGFAVFDIEGPIAHFRCIYSNIAGLSYHFPPRNTLVGILAAILGLEREGGRYEGYYSLFSRDVCDIAVRIMTPLRKVQFSINYLDTGSRGIVEKSKIKGLGPRKQIPLEYVIAKDSSKNVRYRVYVRHSDEDLVKLLVERIQANRPAYPVSLGPAYCLASIQLIEENVEIEEADGNQLYHVITVMPQSRVNIIYEQIDRLQRSGQSLKIVLEERLPPDFGPYRRPVPNTGDNYYFEENGKPVPVKIIAPTQILRIGDFYGVFM
ncbi:MAG: CRISPR-associated protein Cas5 [Thermosphaera sp.]